MKKAGLRFGLVPPGIQKKKRLTRLKGLQRRWCSTCTTRMNCAGKERGDKVVADGLAIFTNCSPTHLELMCLDNVSKRQILPIMHLVGAVDKRFHERLGWGR